MYLAIDIGATKTLISRFSKTGHCLSNQKFPTEKDPLTFEKTLLENLNPLQKYNFEHIVVAVPGIVNKAGEVTPQNLPNWKNFNVQKIIKNLFNCKISVLNDANLATLYESHFKKGLTIYLTFSTGIGGGIAKNGRVTKESAFFEPGHKKYVNPLTNKFLEWEDFASGSAFKKILGKNISEITKKSDFDLIAKSLYPGLCDITNSYHPDIFILGGPLALNFSPIANSLKNLEIQDNNFLPKILAATRPTESVIYGCYLYAKYH